MFNIDNEMLINAIKMRPPIYNKKYKSEYGHRQHKAKLWREISKEIHGNWNQLSKQHKVEFVKEIKKRWKNLRSSFSKELAKQKKENMKREAGQLVKRRKRYEYFDNMLFLMDTTNDGDETKDSDDSADPFDSSYQPEEMISDNGESSSDVKNVTTRDAVETIPEQNYPQPQIVCERNNTLEEKVLDMLKDIKKDEDDEDKQFILSLVPTFRKLNEKQKLTTRIEILKVLQNISFEQN